jgi:hypothetical protein
MDFPYTAKDDVEERKDWVRMKVAAMHVATILSVKNGMNHMVGTRRVWAVKQTSMMARLPSTITQCKRVTAKF